jgi:hypothetical protein
MKKLINFLTITLIAFIIVSCCSQKKATNTVGVYGLSLKYNLVIDNAKQYQVDSLIKADTLPALTSWFTNSFRDYNTNEMFVKRTHIKEYQNNTEITYVITGNGEPYHIEKRIKK